MPASTWSTQQLAEFLAAVSSSDSEASAALAAVERAAEALDAEVGAIVRDGEVLAVVGYPDGAAPAAELNSIAPGGNHSQLDVPGVGLCNAIGVSLEHPSGGTLILARSGAGGLSAEETSLLRGMARVTSMTMRMLRLLDEERTAREESDRQAAENASLLATLRERQRLVERLADEQAALRRVATLVAGQATPDDIFAAVAREMGQLLGADAGAIARHEADGSILVVAGWSEHGSHLPVGTRNSPVSGTVAAEVMRSGRSARVDSYEGVTGPMAEVVRVAGIRSSVGAPIIVDGRVWGVMIASSKRPDALPLETEERLAAFTELVETAISNAEGRAQLTSSRTRIVAAGDETRRRIERDLHDGAQQRLVSLALELRAAEAAVPAELGRSGAGRRWVAGGA
jgi:hypothetical protein